MENFTSFGVANMEDSSQNLTINTILITLGAVVGVSGNVCVLLMYSWRMRRRKDDRYFIPCLAFINLTAVLTSTGFFISLNTFHTDFRSDLSCKLLSFLNRAVFVCSLIILLVIAIQRYKKICKTFGNRISLFWKRMSIITSFIASCVASLPMIVFYGVTDVFNGRTNATEFRCQLRNVDDVYFKYGLYVFHGVIFTIIFIVVTSITLLYLCIGRRIHQKVQQKNGKSLSSSTSSLYSNSLSQADVIVKRSKSDPQIFKIKSKTDNDLSFPTLVTYSGNGVRVMRAYSDMHSNSTAGKRTKNLNIYRYSYMFFTISVVTFISYIPPFIMIILEAIYNDVTQWEGLSHAQLNILLIFRRMYMLSYIANPFLFGLFDRTFRRELKAAICLWKH